MVPLRGGGEGEGTDGATLCPLSVEGQGDTGLYSKPLGGQSPLHLADVLDEIRRASRLCFLTQFSSKLAAALPNHNHGDELSRKDHRGEKD